MSIRKLLLCLLMMVTAACGMQGIAEAQSQAKPVQLALWHPVQLFDSDTSIRGFRLDLLYGVNQDVLGLDLGLVNRTLGDQTGLQLGLANITHGSFVGLRSGAVNMAGGGSRAFSPVSSISLMGKVLDG